METIIALANIAIALADLKPRINDDGCIEILCVTRYGKAILTIGMEHPFGFVTEVHLSGGDTIFEAECLNDSLPGGAVAWIRDLVRRITTKRGGHAVNPITRSNGQATWMPRSGDMFVVTGTRCDGQRFTLTVKSWAHARAINVWRGSKWLLRDGRRWLIQRIKN